VGDTRGAAMWDDTVFVVLFVIQKLGTCQWCGAGEAAEIQVAACVTNQFRRPWVLLSGSGVLRDRYRCHREDGTAAPVSEGTMGGAVPGTRIAVAVVSIAERLEKALGPFLRR